MSWISDKKIMLLVFNWSVVAVVVDDLSEDVTSLGELIKNYVNCVGLESC